MMKKMMKRALIPFLLALTIVLTGCMKDDPVYYLYEEPAVIKYQGEEMMIQTYYGTYSFVYSTTSLYPVSLAEGECIWIQSCTIDERNKSASGAVLATDVVYKRIGKSVAGTFTGDEIVDSYTDTINSTMLYPSTIGYMLFFGFEQKAASGQLFDYEILYNPEEVTDGIPTLYIRSKRVNDPVGDATRLVTHFGFDMTGFVNEFRASGIIRFNLKYLSGKDTNGKDVYTAFSNPITWQI